MGKVAKLSSAVALNSGKQKQFTKTVKRLKKKARSAPVKEGKNTPKDAYLTRGLIYVSHLPHGFFEKQLFQYFKQFGKVTNVRVLRSHNTGRSKGAAFVEFEDPDVAKIAAETMDNYLMFKRRLEAKYVEPENRHQETFKVKITPGSNPKLRNQKRNREMKNISISNEAHEERVKRKMMKLEKSGALEFCQIVKADVMKVQAKKADMAVEVKTSHKKKAAKISIDELPKQLKGLETIKFSKPIEATKEVKPVKKTTQVTTNETNDGFSDESLIINLPQTKAKKKTKVTKTKSLVAVVEEQPKNTKKVSLKTIKKRKDKIIAGNLVQKPQVLDKMATETTAAKAKMMLDSSLVTEVKFNKQKSKKGGAKKLKGLGRK